MDSVETADQESQQVRAAVEAALADVGSLGLSGTDRAVALALVLARRLGVPGNLREAGRAPSPRDEAALEKQTGAGNHGDGLVGRICSTLKIERDVADFIYDEKDGELAYVISSRRLAADKANATRQLAQIVAAGRQAAGLEDWTSSAVIRELASNYGKLDSANFSSHVGGLDKDNAVIFRGKGANRELKVTRVGMESISELLKTLVAS